MLTRPLHRFADRIFLRVSGGDAIAADALRSRATAGFLSFMMITYVPMGLLVAVLFSQRPQSHDANIERDQITMVSAYATDYVNTYLKDPSDTQAISRFYDGDIPASEFAAGGRALWVSSALPGRSVGGFQTYSVVVEGEIPKAANAVSMVGIRLQVDISADPSNQLRAFTLPHTRIERAAGQGVQLATHLTVTEDRPVYRVAEAFLGAMLVGAGDITPYVAYGSGLRAANPPRFATLSVDKVQSNSELATAQDVPPKADGVEVTVRAVLQTASGVLMPQEFPLVMSVAAGHWQVDRINDQPTVVVPSQSEFTPSTVSPSTTTTAPSVITSKGN